MQPAGDLELGDRTTGGRSERVRLVAGGGMSGRAEPAVEILDGVPALTGRQGEVSRNSSSSCNSAPFDLAPTSRLCTSPLSKTNSVGMLITL